MTWAKFGTEFRGQMQLAGLSDAAARTHFEALLWLYEVESADMRIPRRLVRTFAGTTTDPAAAAAELVAAGFWYEDAGAYEVQHHGDVYRQSLAAQLTKRHTEKNRQAAKRAAASRAASRSAVAVVAAPMPDGPTTARVGTNVGTNVGATQSVSQGLRTEGSRPASADLARRAATVSDAVDVSQGTLRSTALTAAADRRTSSGDQRTGEVSAPNGHRRISTPTGGSQPLTCGHCGNEVSRYKTGRLMPHAMNADGDKCPLSDRMVYDS